jgi:hypothetical protein
MKRFLSIAALLMLLAASAFVPVALADDDDDDGGGGGTTTVVAVEQVLQFCMPPDDQVCDPRHQVVFSGEADQVTFDVSPFHCSPVSVELFINGMSQGSSGFLTYVGDMGGLPSSFTWVVDFDAGDDIELQATGRTEGCNTGAVISWGGTLTFEDVAGGDDDDGDDDDGDDDDGDDDDD